MRHLTSMVIISVVSLGSLFSVATVAQQHQLTVPELVKTSVSSAVLVVVNDENGKPTAEGSGFIASADGKIVTNHHVIAGAHSAVVKLDNGSFFPVEGVLADDPAHDIAVLKVSGKNLPTLTVGDSDTLSAGDHVVAIGSPLGLENSVSDGIVSGFREDSKGRNWIQTTAPVSHGNSGGPLLTMEGRVTGIITWKASEGENLNFAVPSKLFVKLLTESTVQPLGTMTKADAGTVRSSDDTVWTSMQSGRDWKVRIDGDYIYVMWVNLPPALQSTAAFVRSELKKSGDKWTGTTSGYAPVSNGHIQKWCKFESRIEIDKVSENRIEGRALNQPVVNPKNCVVEKQQWDSFIWIPK